MSTSAPSAPAASRSATVRSAASPLPMPPGSTTTPGGAVTVISSRVDGDAADAAEAERRRGEHGHAGRVLDAAPVAVGDEHRKHGRIEPALGDPPRLDHRREQRDRRRIDDDRLGRPSSVDAGDVAVGEEAAPALLEVLEQPARARSMAPAGAPVDDDVGVARHDPESALSGCHGSWPPGRRSSGRWHARWA